MSSKSVMQVEWTSLVDELDVRNKGQRGSKGAFGLSYRVCGGVIC